MQRAGQMCLVSIRYYLYISNVHNTNNIDGYATAQELKWAMFVRACSVADIMGVGELRSHKLFYRLACALRLRQETGNQINCTIAVLNLSMSVRVCNGTFITRGGRVR